VYEAEEIERGWFHHLASGPFSSCVLAVHASISARQNHSVAHPADRIYLDVVVSSTSGPPVSSSQ